MTRLPRVRMESYTTRAAFGLSPAGEGIVRLRAGPNDARRGGPAAGSAPGHGRGSKRPGLAGDGCPGVLHLGLMLLGSPSLFCRQLAGAAFDGTTGAGCGHGWRPEARLGQCCVCGGGLATMAAGRAVHATNAVDASGCMRPPRGLRNSQLVCCKRGWCIQHAMRPSAPRDRLRIERLPAGQCGGHTPYSRGDWAA